MTTNAGIWIDHRKAVIVTVGGPGEEHRSVILSKVEKHPERASDSPLRGRYEARQVPADDKRRRNRGQNDGSANDGQDTAVFRTAFAWLGLSPLALGGSTDP
jgi:hypothetical protein